MKKISNKNEKYYTMLTCELKHSKNKEKLCFSSFQEKLVRQAVI